MVDVARLLETLHPMREPPPPQAITPALILTAIGCLAAAALFVAVWRARGRYAALRRAAEATLAASRRLAPAERLAAQAQLLRRLVRGLAGEGEARKQGRAWLESLDRVFATRFFTEGDGTAFGEALYRPQPSADIDALDHSLAALFAKVRA